MTSDDKPTSAQIDGMLDGDDAERMIELAANDEDIAMRELRLRQLDDLVRAAVPAEEAIPKALLERLGLADEQRHDTVVDLSAARRQRSAQAAMPAPSRSSGLWQMAAQVALVAGIGIALVVWALPGQPIAEPDAAYRTLSSAVAPATLAANALIKFAPGTSADMARTIASTAGARLIGAPSAAGAWKAAVLPARRETVLGGLRHDPHVVMAEPIDGTAP